jgi:HAD superfamily hydrolase (TIGR01459 family)
MEEILMFDVKGFKDIAPLYDTYVFDIWGVIHNGVQLYPGVLNCLEQLNQLKKRIAFLSNSPRAGSPHHEQFFEALGLRRDLYEFIYTSGDALTMALEKSPTLSKTDDFFFLGDDTLHQSVWQGMQGQRVPLLNEAAYILCTAPTPHQRKILEEARTLNLPMLCSNPDRFAVKGSTKILCAGSVAEEYEHMGGAVIYCGKPERFMFESMLERLKNFEVETTVMVGDGLFTDIKGAKTVGLPSVFIQGGVHADEEASHDLKAWFTSQGIVPTHVMPSVRW